MQHRNPKPIGPGSCLTSGVALRRTGAFYLGFSSMDETKKCNKCGETKILTEMCKCGKGTRPAGGDRPLCKKCKTAATRQQRLNKIDQYRKSDKRYYSKNIEKKKEDRRRRTENHPEKDGVRYLFVKAIASGKIVRPSCCSECGHECLPHGHHEDYSKPYSVIWLCPSCHHGLHRRREREAIIS